MKNLGLILLLFCGISSISKAQMTIEEQVADSACTCLSEIDTSQANIKGKINVLRMACMDKAIDQNKESIKKNYSTQQRKEEDQANAGIQGSLYIGVQKELAKNCPIYSVFQQKVTSYRAAGKAAASMSKKKDGTSK